MHPFQPAPNPAATQGKQFAGTDRAVAAAAAPKADLNLELRRNIYDQSGKEIAAKPENKQVNGDEGAANGATTREGVAGSKTLEELAKEPRKVYNCFSCGVDCTRLRYHSAKSISIPAGVTSVPRTKYDICSNCFLEGRFPGSSSAVDFIKLEDPSYSSVPDRDGPWTTTEQLLLLEGLEMFDENWNAIADHVGTRTREECVLKFLQADIEDKYLDSEIAPEGAAGPTAASSILGPLASGRVPFSPVENPVLSVVSFLASTSSQERIAESVGKSVEELRRSLRRRLEIGTEGEGMDEQQQQQQQQQKQRPHGDDVDGDSKMDDGGPPSPSERQQREAVKHEDSMEIDHVEPSSSSPHEPQQARSSSADAVAVQPAAGGAARSSSSAESPLTMLSTSTLSMVATRAGGLFSHEERNVMRLVSQAVNASLQKHELKQRQFNDMEAILAAERRELERARTQLYMDRLAFKKRVAEIQAALHTASITGGEEGLAIAQAVTSQFLVNERFRFRSAGAAGADAEPVDTSGGGVSVGGGGGGITRDSSRSGSRHGSAAASRASRPSSSQNQTQTQGQGSGAAVFAGAPVPAPASAGAAGVYPDGILPPSQDPTATFRAHEL